ncbi:MAG: hypothetical protein P8X76_08100 [Maritimibacter sp.]
MILSFLILGLLPLALLADLFVGGDGDSAESDDPVNEDADMSAGTGAGDGGDLLTPQNDAGDEANNQGGGQGDDADGGVILQPQNDSIDDPINNDPIDGDTILDPTTDPSGDYPYAADPGLLQQRLESETDFNFGSGYLAEFGDEPEQIEQTGDDNSFSAVDDGLAGTGEGALNTRDGTPMLASDTPRRRGGAVRRGGR